MYRQKRLITDGKLLEQRLVSTRFATVLQAFSRPRFLHSCLQLHRAISSLKPKLAVWTSCTKVNQLGAKFYSDLIDALLAHGIEYGASRRALHVAVVPTCKEYGSVIDITYDEKKRQLDKQAYQYYIGWKQSSHFVSRLSPHLGSVAEAALQQPALCMYAINNVQDKSDDLQL
eukprot:5033684-Amphidinium_carterae.1